MGGGEGGRGGASREEGGAGREEGGVSREGDGDGDGDGEADGEGYCKREAGNPRLRGGFIASVVAVVFGVTETGADGTTKKVDVKWQGVERG